MQEHLKSLMKQWNDRINELTDVDLSVGQFKLLYFDEEFSDLISSNTKSKRTNKVEGLK